MGITLEEEVEVRPRNPDDTFTILIDHKNQSGLWLENHYSPENKVKKAIEYYRNSGYLKPILIYVVQKRVIKVEDIMKEFTNSKILVVGGVGLSVATR